MTPEEQKAKRKAYYERNKETIAAKKKIYMEANKEKFAALNKARYEAKRESILAQKKIYGAANREKINARMKIYSAANREKLAAKNKAWAEANKEYIKAKAKEYSQKRGVIDGLRRAGPATPPWCDTTACEHFYELRTAWNEIWPEDPVEVDHIVPLKTRDKSVCGLHVPWNLQVLRRLDNKKKGNKYERDFVYATA